MITTFKFQTKTGEVKTGKVFHDRPKPDGKIAAVYAGIMDFEKGAWDVETKTDLVVEWETAKATNPEVNRCGHHDRSKTPWRRCFRPEGHVGEHLF